MDSISPSAPRVPLAAKARLQQGIWGSAYMQNGLTLIDSTVAAHAGSSHFGYIIRDDNGSFKLLPALARAGQGNLITNPIVLGPTEAPTKGRKGCLATKYFGGNYPVLFSRLAAQMKQHPGIGDVIIDDYGHSMPHRAKPGCLVLSTKLYKQLSSRLAPVGRKIIPTLYPNQMTTDRYSRELDATRPTVVLAYNRLNSKHMGRDVRQAHAAWPHTKFIILVYFGPYHGVCQKATNAALQLRQATALDRQHSWVVGTWKYKPQLPKAKSAC